MNLQAQINAACKERGYYPEDALAQWQFKQACALGRWEAGGGMERVARALEHPTSNIQHPTSSEEKETVAHRKEYNPRGKEDAVLSRMNGHPMRLGELRGELNVMTLHQVLNRLISRGAVRKVKHGHYEKVIRA